MLELSLRRHTCSVSMVPLLWETRAAAQLEEKLAEALGLVAGNDDGHAPVCMVVSNPGEPALEPRPLPVHREGLKGRGTRECCGTEHNAPHAGSSK